MFARVFHACVPCTYMRTRECVRSARWACTRASKNVGACVLLLCDIQKMLEHPPCPFPKAITIVGRLPPLNYERAAAKPTIGVRQRRIGFSSCSPLPAPWSAKTSHPASHQHNTLACNHTSLPPPPRPHCCTS